MSTSMPYSGPLIIEPRDITPIMQGGVGHLLIWNEAADKVEAVQPGHVPGEEAMILAGADDLERIAEEAAEEGEGFTDTYAAATLRDMAGDLLEEWPAVKALTAGVLELRTDMARRFFYLTGAPSYRECARTHFLTDVYRNIDRPDVTVSVTSTFMHTTPARIHLTRTKTGRDLARFDIQPSGARPSLAAYAVAGAVEAAIEALPKR
ncbi:hypothetical protein ACFPZ0_11305 [Streptomonospora nanhaiensis]|uniref:Uncharacterized protein n=1 Tax=Streptomonospora nanhaiensis TaxID=1323731 RepID=A0A853BU91_9ACTN|nr:hypothetical protein [Streptomonospora nanhaiensis]MBV2365998.1 hypothetical protein [Streptomonospora nanhaiensis]MBX9388821.1 hypothetical protein [Streptomonospora nanhaiensis]NYI98315.1 hypothetical protein [Streptomonospora nanhaiensis]